MATKSLMFAIALAVPAVAVAQTNASRELTFRENVQARYCEKLREGPEAYAQFVHAMRIVHGYTYTDFASFAPGDTVKVDCKQVMQRVQEASAPSKTANKVAEKEGGTR